MAAVLDALRIATAFFGKGQFTSESLEEKNGVYVLPFIGAATSNDSTLFANRRAEGYWRVRQAMEAVG